MRHLLVAIALLSGAALSGCEATVERAPVSSAEIVIATAGPMSGDLAEFGSQMKHGAEKAVADINSAGGVLGKQLRLEIGDDACDPKRAVSVAGRLVSRNAVFVDGHFCSGSSIPASAVYHEAAVLQITPASSNPKLTDDAAASGWTTVFRTCGRDDRQADFAGAWLATHYQGKRVAIVHDNSGYGKSLADTARRAMNAGGLHETLYESISPGRHDYGTLVAKLKTAGIDVVYFGGYHPEAALIVRQMREQGVQAQMLGADALNTLEFATLAGSAANGVMFTNEAEPRNRPAAREVVEAFRTSGYEPEDYTLSSYAAVQVWAQAVAKAGTTDALKVAETLRSQPWDTVIGAISFDAKGDLTRQNYVWYVFRNGNYSEAGV